MVFSQGIFHYKRSAYNKFRECFWLFFFLIVQVYRRKHQELQSQKEEIRSFLDFFDLMHQECIFSSLATISMIFASFVNDVMIQYHYIQGADRRPPLLNPSETYIYILIFLYHLIIDIVD